MDVRAELSRLMHDGLSGRTRTQLWQQAQAYFTHAKEPLVHEAFRRWLLGLAFPSTWRRQLLLADVVGGDCGEAIKRLKGPPFRSIRRRLAQENDSMKKDLSSKSMSTRPFAMVRRVGEDGIARMEAQIKCVECGFTYHHRHHGSLSSEQYFKKKDWEVGNNDKHDYCPQCVENRRKVVKMSDHKKTDGNGAERSMSKEDGRLIFKAIEAHWDDNLVAYHPGWSDMKIAEENGVPLDWVAKVRDDLYGGAGEDPGVASFIAEQMTLKGDLDALAKDLGELETSATQVQRLIAGYREKHNGLSGKVHRLSEVAGRLRPPFRDAG